MGFPLPRGRGLGARAVPDEASATVLRVSALSPLDRRDVLPPHHPHRGLSQASYPYPMWSGGRPAESSPRPPETVHLRGNGLEVVVDLARGARIVGVSSPAGSWTASVRAAAEPADVRGIGLRGGIEVDVSPFQRSPLALERVFAAVGLPTRCGGDRLRWWQLERASGHVVQADLHLVGGAVGLVMLLRQVPFAGPTNPPPQPRLLVDDATVLEARDGLNRLALGDHALHLVGADAFPAAGGVRVEARPRGQVSWVALSLEAGDHSPAEDLLSELVAAMDDPVMASCGRIISHGSGWAALELERLADEGLPNPLDTAATPLPRLVHEEISTRLRETAEAQWLHLMRDEGLGMTDRVHPRDLGQPAGRTWVEQLRRAHRREALGDWRVHLRSGEIALLDGDAVEAQARWAWSHALRPTAWSDRNLALVQVAAGDLQEASTSYLRAHRTQTDEVELGVEAVGVLIAAGRAADARQVLDRMLLADHGGTVRHWLLEAEVAMALEAHEEAARALATGAGCGDASVHAAWAARLLDDLHVPGSGGSWPGSLSDRPPRGR